MKQVLRPAVDIYTRGNAPEALGLSGTADQSVLVAPKTSAFKGRIFIFYHQNLHFLLKNLHFCTNAHNPMPLEAAAVADGPGRLHYYHYFKYKVRHL